MNRHEHVSRRGLAVALINDGIIHARRTMTDDTLRQALGELNGKRDVEFIFERADPLRVPKAMLLPDEADHLVKLTDGKHVYIIDAGRVAWLKIG